MALSFANKVTIGRILLVPFFIVICLSYTPEQDYIRYIILGLFLLAVVTDVIDGYIARTRHEKTQAGAILDPLADKILLISAFICLYKVGIFMGEVHFPLWFVLAMISRDVILVIGSTIIYIVQGHLNIIPTRWGKATTFFQILCVFGILLQWSFSSMIWYVALVLTLISGVGYIHHGIKVLNVAPIKK